MKRITALIFSILLLNGCMNGSYEISEESKTKPLITQQKQISPQRSYVYARGIDSRESLSKLTVATSVREPKTLRYLLLNALPNYRIVPGDVDVNLDQKYKINLGSLTVPQFLEYMEGITGYQIRVKNKRIDVKAFVTQSWAMEPFTNSKKYTSKAVARSGTGISSSDESSEGSGSDDGESDRTHMFVETSRGDGDDWSGLLTSGRNIIGIEEDQGNNNSNAPMMRQDNDPFNAALRANGGRELNLGDLGAQAQAVATLKRFAPKSYINGNRLSGVIQAGGPAYKIRELDAYYTKIFQKVTQVIHVQFYVMEVKLNEGKQKIINWDGLKNVMPSGNNLIAQLTRNVAPASNQLFNFGASYEGDNFSITSFMSFLENYGEVSVLSEPNTSALHGTPVVFRAGESIPVLLEIEQIIGGDGLGQNGIKVDQLDVGVNVSTTSWLMDDGRILVDVMPSISSVSGEQVFQFGDLSLPIPRVSFTDLSTRVAVEPGRPIILGGLTRSSISEAFDGMPVENKVMKGVLKAPFSNVNNSLERTELVIVVKPTLVEGYIR